MFNLLLILIFLRPFISYLLFPRLDIGYSLVFLFAAVLWLISKKRLSLKIHFRAPVLFFFSTIVLSCLLSPNILNSVKEMYKYLTYFAGFYIACQAVEKERQKIILALFLAAVIIGLIGLYQYFFGFQVILEFLTKFRPVGFNFAQKYLEQKRVFAIFTTPTVFAGYLIIIIPLIAGYLYEKKHKFIFWPLTCVIIILSICLFFTKSIGAFISLSIGITIFFILTDILDKKTFFLSLIVFVLIFTLLLIVRNYLRPETSPAFSTTMSQREIYWQETFRIILGRPLTGTGPGNFSIPGTKFSHNSYLQIWAELGILALISYLRLVFVCLKAGLYRLRLLKLKDFLGVGMLSGIVAAFCAFFIHNIVDFTFFIPEVSLFAWILLGLIVNFY